MLKLVSYICLILVLFEVSNSGLTNKYTQNKTEETGYIIDSEIEFEEAISGKSIPQSIIENLRLVNVYYFGFDERLHKGQLVAHKDVVLDLIEIFEFIRETKFPVDKVIPISKYSWSDEQSMMDNNTSAFNYRYISGTRVISNHALGLAIDINPSLNPYVKNGNTIPANCKYDISKPGTIAVESELVLEFKKRGWQWGGEWKSLKDYQHFEKVLN